MYYRFYNDKSPLCEYGYAMFVENDRDSVSGYGPSEYHYDGTDGVKIEDLYAAITEAWEENYEVRPVDSMELTAGEVCECFTPDNIVDGANGFDDGKLVQWLWENVLDHMSIFAVLTPEGAIVFDEEMIQVVENEDL